MLTITKPMHHIPEPILEKYFSKSRLQKIREFAGNDDYLEFFKLNMIYSEKLYSLLSQFEIILRNAVSGKLIKLLGEKWFDSKEITLPWQRGLILEAKSKLIKGNKEIDSCNITSNLTFGFWVNLFNPNYDILWRTCLSQIFPDRKAPPKRSLFRDRLKNFNRLRNRISHCELILNPRLDEYCNQLIETLSWINSDIAKWLDEEINFSNELRPK